MSIPFAASSGYSAVLIICLAIVALVVGTIFVVDQRRKRSLGVADEEPAAAGPWYRQFTTRFRTRARFALSLDVDGADPNGEVLTASHDPTVELRVSVAVANDSKADSGQTTLTVLVPRGCEAQWIGAGQGVPEPVTEALGDEEHPVKADALRKVVSHIAPGDERIATLTLTVPVPADSDRAIEIPLRFRAVAPELGVGDDPVIDRAFSVRRY